VKNPFAPIGPDGRPRPKDHLTTALCLAVACHVVILLGVGFRGTPRSEGDPTGLEVVLVHDPVADARTNAQADYLADVNQRGAGTADDVRRAETVGGTPATGANGTASGGSDHAEGSGENDILATRQRGNATSATLAIAAGERTPLLVTPSGADDTSFDTGDALALRGKPRNELVVTANTRASGVAVYLDAWRHRIERIGTANYPLDIIRRAHLTGSPIVEVRVGSDGRLVDARVVRSSGHIALDQAAMNILRLAAPFEPFPSELAAAHDSLRLSYEWQFSDGEWRDSTVRIPGNTP